MSNITQEQCEIRQSKVYKKLDQQEVRAEERHSELLAKISFQEGAHSSSVNWAGYVVPILAAILAAWLASHLAGCTTTTTDTTKAGVRTEERQVKLFNYKVWLTKKLSTVQSKVQKGFDMAQKMFFWLSLACFALGLLSAVAAYLTKGYKKFGLAAGMFVLCGMALVTFMITVQIWVWVMVAGLLLALGTFLYHHKDKGLNVGDLLPK